MSFNSVPQVIQTPINSIIFRNKILSSYFFHLLLSLFLYYIIKEIYNNINHGYFNLDMNLSDLGESSMKMMVD